MQETKQDTAAKRVPGKPFKKGQPRHPAAGRKSGVPNKIKVELEALRASVPTSIGIDDELQFLRWVWQNEAHRLDLRLKAASEAASYKYAKRTHNTHDLSDETRRIADALVSGRERVAKAKPPEGDGLADNPATSSDPVSPDAGRKPPLDLSQLSDEELERMIEEKRRHG